MAGTRIKVVLGRTVNLGNYESLRIDLGMERDLNKGEDEHIAMLALEERMADYIDEMVEGETQNGE